ncbi:MazG-like family protein [Brevibacillus sp. DP1.3A]|uniref:MazG-like family protein n=1 Tax=Brevibacillus sp. DP1.3A TaxID=2738867 RepID=UPI001D15F92F|nr:MazG-like family protein [Brevibacillus sp. DP1.3A]MED1919502.1 MazG-like family protein [Bacillus thuringiensis]UED77476.1 MazG-like family protein [Brevibacillus sp. DP1.3A]
MLERVTMVMDKVNSDVLEERCRQDAKWGKQRHDLGRWLAILTEEVGEVSQAMQGTWGWGKPTDSKDLYKELIQVAAVASAIAEQVREQMEV